MKKISMKLTTKIPQSDPQRHLQLIDEKWTALNIPDSLFLTMILSIPLMILNALITLGILSLFSLRSLIPADIMQEGFVITIDLKVLIGFAALLFLHEILHLIFIPGFWRSDKTCAGLTYLGAFVYSEQNISKSRYIIITLAPFILISVIMPLILGVLNLLSTSLAVLIILNSMASSVDILNLILIFTKVPKGSQLTSNGTKTYWRMQ